MSCFCLGLYLTGGIIEVPLCNNGDTKICLQELSVYPFFGQDQVPEMFSLGGAFGRYSFVDRLVLVPPYFPSKKCELCRRRLRLRYNTTHTVYLSVQQQ